jgi:hypothetical protein
VVFGLPVVHAPKRPFGIKFEKSKGISSVLGFQHSMGKIRFYV